MGHMSYNRVGRRCYGSTRGFKLNSRRFSVQRLRAKFLYLCRLFSRSWRSSYGHALRLLKKNFNCSKQKGGSCRRSLVTKEANYAMYGINRNCEYRLKSYGRSNSFYAEAIADCLDFIKRNSLSMEEKPIGEGKGLFHSQQYVESCIFTYNFFTKRKVWPLQQSPRSSTDIDTKSNE
ncbi:hypothetical protein RND71_033882 [Anisodus tanguticus]|uniref:Uncharacterized protein n=1 Tax=Anisodus tanguticus TaxID=243964 RepID=A0AAE1UWJ0_9SOLA|nr:hypothetical protein RND71_033882 [Anisodus tanguticus]